MNWDADFNYWPNFLSQMQYDPALRAAFEETLRELAMDTEEVKDAKDKP